MAELKDIQDMKLKAAERLVELKKIQKKDIIKATVETQRLKVALTQDELLRAGDELSEAIREISSLEEEKKAFVANIAAKVKEFEGKGEVARQLIQNKYDQRKTDCVEIMDNTNGLVFTIRMDTGEVIKERKMTSDERQSEINWPSEQTD